MRVYNAMRECVHLFPEEGGVALQQSVLPQQRGHVREVLGSCWRVKRCGVVWSGVEWCAWGKGG